MGSHPASTRQLAWCHHRRCYCGPAALGDAPACGASAPFTLSHVPTTACQGEGWSVSLDGRILRTPAKNPMRLPSHALALALAAEWEWQHSSTIRPFTMPLTVRACPPP